MLFIISLFYFTGRCTQPKCKYYHYPTSEHISEIPSQPRGGYIQNLPPNLTPVLQQGIISTQPSNFCNQNLATVSPTGHFPSLISGNIAPSWSRWLCFVIFYPLVIVNKLILFLLKCVYCLLDFSTTTTNFFLLFRDFLQIFNTKIALEQK